MTSLSTLRAPASRTCPAAAPLAALRTSPDTFRRAARNTVLAAAAALSMGLAQAVEVESLSDKATAGQWADVGTTGIGLALGAAEANPLGILTLGVKAIAYQQIKEAPLVEQPRLWSTYGAFGWGAAANNVCVIAAVASGGIAAAVCPLIGLVAGMGTYAADADRRDRATFAAICQEYRKDNPDMTCTYTAPKG